MLSGSAALGKTGDIRLLVGTGHSTEGGNVLVSAGEVHGVDSSGGSVFVNGASGALDGGDVVLSGGSSQHEKGRCHDERYRQNKWEHPSPIFTWKKAAA